ncbi:MAG TPA: ABC transporter permease [Candidatus Polarisedimenticolia bacterium]|nr:ABC transporter permease [Candidatus Polarisedimenticolia bacterium]
MRVSSRSGGLLGAGTTVLLALVTLGFLAPWLAPHPPSAQDLPGRFAPPSASHPLGQDDLGRDVLSRLLYGARVSLPLAIAVVGLSLASGTVLGGAAALAGGAFDAALAAIMDVLLAFPGLLLAIALIAVRGPGLSNLVIALALLGWVPFARLARGETLRLADRPFVEAARAAGGRRARILATHLVPHLAPPLLTQAALALGGVIVAEAGLSFLGLGLPEPAPSWGGMLRDGTQHLLEAPRLAVYPGALIALAVLGAQGVAEGLKRRAAATSPRAPVSG